MLPSLIWSLLLYTTGQAHQNLFGNIRYCDGLSYGGDRDVYEV